MMEYEVSWGLLVSVSWMVEGWELEPGSVLQWSILGVAVSLYFVPSYFAQTSQLKK